MPTNRELFFQFLNENNKYLTRMVIKSLLNDVNDYHNELDLYKNFDKECPDLDRLLDNVNRVRNGEPFQYVLGYTNFLDHIFEVNKNVLIPRQETEELVVTVKKIIQTAYGDDASIVIGDIGTGSGVIGVTLAKAFPNSQVYMSDIDDDAIEVAATNAGNLEASVLIFKGNMCDPFISKGIKLDVLVSNPPYIDGPKTIDEQVWKYEPHKALLASPDTKYYEEIISHNEEIMNDTGLLAFEIGEEMEEPLTAIVKKYMPNARYDFVRDMYGKMRFLFIIKQGE